MHPQFRLDVSLRPPITLTQVHAVLPTLAPKQLQWASDWIRGHDEDPGATIDVLVDSMRGLSAYERAFAKCRIYGPFTTTLAERILPDLNVQQQCLVRRIVEHNRFLMESSTNKAAPPLVTIDHLVSGIAGLTAEQRARARSRIAGSESFWQPFGKYPYVSHEGLLEAAKFVRNQRPQYWLHTYIVSFPSKTLPATAPRSKRNTQQGSRNSTVVLWLPSPGSPERMAKKPSGCRVTEGSWRMSVVKMLGSLARAVGPRDS
jgi:hypothetical protein